MELLEVFEDVEHYIIQAGRSTLWCSRIDGSLTARPGISTCKNS